MNLNLIGKVKNYLKLIRIHQIHKNAFVFAPLIFSKGFFFADKTILTLLAALSFYLASSLVYVINDYVDIESDKIHPNKKFRPLASGAVTKKEAMILLFILITGNTISVFLWSRKIEVSIVLILFLINNILYSFITKKIAYLDTLQNSFGYILRVLAGSYAISVIPSVFLIMLTFLIAFCISLAKRILELNFVGKKARKSLQNYDKSLTVKLFNVSLFLFTFIYGIYTITTDQQNRLILVTFPFVLFLAFRFLKLINSSDLYEDDPSKLFLQNKLNFIISFITVVILIVVVYEA